MIGGKTKGGSNAIQNEEISNAMRQRTRPGVVCREDIKGSKNMKEYTGKHFPGEIVYHGEFECEVLEVWTDDEGKNGITIEPTGGYGFPVDIYDEQL